MIDEWAAVAEDLRSEEFGVRTAGDLIPDMTARGWDALAAQALCDWWQNHHVAEDWPVSWLVRVFQGPPVTPQAGLPLQKTGKPVDVRGDWEAQQADRRREQDEQRRLASQQAEQLAEERLERLGPRIDAMSIEERQALLDGDWYRQQVMVRGKDWRGAKLLQVALLAAVVRQDEEAGENVDSAKPGNSDPGATIRRVVGRAVSARAAGADSGG